MSYLRRPTQSFSTIVGIIVPPLQRGNAALDALRRKSAERRTIIELSAQTDAELQYDSWDYRSLRSSVGMQLSTLCVARGRGASRPACRRRASHDSGSCAQRTCQPPPSALYSAMLACKRASRNCTLTSCA
ncbi:hypothetical protein BKM09_024755 [Pseudomonas amygdali pv. morsprunorum]|nr:hypothetical protein BKM09_024755 [Pseudomonas amygdali pv. morsprunorum]